MRYLDIPLTNLIPVEEALDSDQFATVHISNYLLRKEGKKISPIWVFSHPYEKGNFLIYDGKHRAVSCLILNDPSVPSYLMKNLRDIMKHHSGESFFERPESFEKELELTLKSLKRAQESGVRTIDDLLKRFVIENFPI